MRVLLVASRFPWPPHTGDRLRTSIWIDALASEHEITLVAPAGVVPAGAPAIRHVVLRPALTSLAAAGTRALAGALPFQSLLAAGFDWPRAFREAGEGFDVAVSLLARSAPWVAGRLPAKRAILDAVDATSVNSAERARAASGPARIFWEIDARRMARLERDAASQFEQTLVVSDAECARFGPRAIAVPNGVEITPEPRPERADFDFAFWGNLAYFANRDAVAFLTGSIWPRLLRLRPGATLVIAGANAPAALRRLQGRDGISVLSPAGDRAALLRRVRVALLPLRAGSGVSNKVLEGAEASCALVGTSLAFRGLGDLAAGQVVEDDAGRLASACAELLADPGLVAARGQEARRRVLEAHDRQQTASRLLEITRGEEGGDYNRRHE